MTQRRRTEADRPSIAGADGVQVLRGVGAKGAELLARLDIARVQDLWFHLPLRYEDRTRITPIRELAPGVKAQVLGRVSAVERGFRFRPLLRVTLEDDSGGTLVLRFFHFNAAQARSFEPGQRIVCYGEPRWGQLGPEMVHPGYRRVADQGEVELDSRLRPVYPTTEGLDSRRLAGWIDTALSALPSDDALELIPGALLVDAELPSIGAALRYVHAPPPDAQLDKLAEGRHPSQRRLIVEELLAHHLSLKQRRARMREIKAPVLQDRHGRAGQLRAALPFALTAAQERVVADISADLERRSPMLRLIQGDVGSGKTVLAALAAARAIDAGVQVALVAPTELLAEQHLQTLRAWFEPFGVEPVWLAGKVSGRARSSALAAVAAGAPLVIGTHALMQEAVVFSRLGLVIVDEQHRFGVHQRLSLSEKGRHGDRVPHQLVLTATPIPRTLAMAAYADLDVSVVDELPPGRTPVRTVLVAASRRGEVVERIREACGQGRQAYWVCTLIEEADEADAARGRSRDAQAAQVAWQELALALPGLRVGLVHGRLKPREKQATMQAFKAGELDVLVATTVIEVGVDVPNASLMIIENAERLGLAQLHQLRGRVGRGAQASSCVLLYQPPLSALARARLQVLRETNDGFRIAERDLELRGPGEVLGTRQTGAVEFRIADLARDGELLPLVQRIATRLRERDPAAAQRIVARWVGSTIHYAGA
ncbi:MAG: ATP-dependent DNA helicase RecG [Dokdonella sp.]|nr:ATP-dependent DNA helicase RecG [Dokdonella sp.]